MSESVVIRRSTHGRPPHLASRMKAGNSTHTYRRWLMSRPELRGMNVPKSTKADSPHRFWMSKTKPRTTKSNTAVRSIQLSMWMRPARRRGPPAFRRGLHGLEDQRQGGLG